MQIIEEKMIANGLVSENMIPILVSIGKEDSSYAQTPKEDRCLIILKEQVKLKKQTK